MRVLKCEGSLAYKYVMGEDGGYPISQNARKYWLVSEKEDLSGFEQLEVTLKIDKFSSGVRVYESEKAIDEEQVIDVLLIEHLSGATLRSFKMERIRIGLGKAERLGLSTCKPISN